MTEKDIISRILRKNNLQHNDIYRKLGYSKRESFTRAINNDKISVKTLKKIVEYFGYEVVIRKVDKSEEMKVDYTDINPDNFDFPLNLEEILK